MSQVKGFIIPSHLPLFSIRGHPLKLEVIFCVQAVVSPLLANVYLHYVFDLWVDFGGRKCEGRCNRRPLRG